MIKLEPEEPPKVIHFMTHPSVVCKVRVFFLFFIFSGIIVTLTKEYAITQAQSGQEMINRINVMPKWFPTIFKVTHIGPWNKISKTIICIFLNSLQKKF